MYCSINRKPFLLVILILLIATSLFAQQKKFVVKEAPPPKTPPILTEYKDYAAIFIYSSLTNLRFESTLGIVGELSKSLEGRYIIIIHPNQRQAIKIKADGFRTFTQKLPPMKKRGKKYFNVEQLLIKGDLVINSTPDDAQVYINGTYKSNTPFKEKYNEGTYEVVLKKEMYRDVIQTIKVLPNKTNDYVFDMPPAFGSLTVTSKPAGAEIFLDNSKIGETPVTKERIASGEHMLLARLKPYGDVRKTIVIKDGQETVDNILMKKTQSAILLEKQQTWKLRRTWTLMGTGVFAAAGLGLKYLADQKFDDYERATSTSDATNLRGQVEDYDMYSLIGFGISGVFAGWTAYNHFKIPKSSFRLSVNKNETKVVASISF